MSDVLRAYTYADVWNTLSAVNVNEYVKKKNDLSYLSWAWAWQVLMEHFPEAEFAFEEFASSDGNVLDAMFYPNGTASVHCTIMIGDLSRSMWLPVMTGFKNTAVASPGARDIGDAKMRCLVKVMALFGLGHYIYAGEDLPSEEEGKAPTKQAPPELSPEIRAKIEEIIEVGKALKADGNVLDKELRAQISKAIKEENLGQLDQCFQDLTALQELGSDSSEEGKSTDEDDETDKE